MSLPNRPLLRPLIRPLICPLPPETRIARLSQGADFADCYEVDHPHPTQTACQSAWTLMRSTPAWVDGLMHLRNRVVQWVGLKNLGGLSALPPDPVPAHCQVGQRLGIFSVHSVSADEIVLTDSDRHLDVWVSLSAHRPHGHPPRLRVATVVKIHNRLGRVYMAVVAPVHRRIVPAMLRRLAHA